MIYLTIQVCWLLTVVVIWRRTTTTGGSQRTPYLTLWEQSGVLKFRRTGLLEVDLAVDPQVQPEFGQAIQPEASDSIVVEAQGSTKQLQIAGASFLVTLKEKYKVQIMHEIHLLFFSLHASDHPVCRRLC